MTDTRDSFERLICTGIGNCSYYCKNPDCIRHQRDELRDKFIIKIEADALIAAALERLEPLAPDGSDSGVYES